MKIDRIEKFKVRVPAKPGTVNSPQWGPPVFDQVPKFILRIHIIGNLLRQDDLIVEPIKFEDGYALVPQEAGLGIELDEAALEKYGIR